MSQLLNQDGDNLAVDRLLFWYGEFKFQNKMMTVQDMQQLMAEEGFEDLCPEEFKLLSNVILSKNMIQKWLRYLFDLEHRL